MLIQQLLLVICGYLLGSVLFSYHLPLWISRVDVVALSADHNPGTVNAFRYAGIPVGILCLICDLMKGALPVWLGVRLMGAEYPLLPAVMLAPVLGHATTPWYGFPGGKAIAAAFGALIGLLPVSGAVYLLAFWYIFFSVIWIIHPNELRTVVTFILFSACVVALSFYTRRFMIALGCVLTALPPVYKNYADLSRAKRTGETNENEDE